MKPPRVILLSLLVWLGMPVLLPIRALMALLLFLSIGFHLSFHAEIRIRRHALCAGKRKSLAAESINIHIPNSLRWLHL